MAEEKIQKQQEEVQKQERQAEEVKKLTVDLPDIITETYAKSYMAYRISLENWFLLNEILAFIKNEKLTSKEVQSRLQRLFSVINTEIVKEFVKLNQIAVTKAKAVAEEETKETEEEEKEEKE
jgi:hypothetical protein